MRTDVLNYELPVDRIASNPAEPRDSARLMVVHREKGRIEHLQVRNLTSHNLLRSGDLMVFNRTRVLPAQFSGRRCTTGGRVGGLYLETQKENGDTQWRVLLESRGTLRVGETISLRSITPAIVDGGDTAATTFEGGTENRGATDAAELKLLEQIGKGQWRVQIHSDLPTLMLLERIGAPPLPPYIRAARQRLGRDEIVPGDMARYNTVFATDPGSVAAPTAALHFTPQLLSEIDELGIRRAMLTLHVGLGTFSPIRTDRLEEHQMHREWISVPAATIDALHHTRHGGGRIVVVGTTCVRALESLPDPLPEGDFQSQTNLFITPTAGTDPPFPFRFTDVLMTNFHLPRSTLLALVAALPGVGLQRLREWYGTAVQEKYRFYSYGDAMLLT